jgi:hypothetical protein
MASEGKIDELIRCGIMQEYHKRHHDATADGVKQYFVRVVVLFPGNGFCQYAE